VLLCFQIANFVHHRAVKKQFACPIETQISCDLSPHSRLLDMPIKKILKMFYSLFFFSCLQYEKKLLLWNSSSERNLFYEFEYEIEIRGVAWISETQIALSFESGLIEIYEIDEGQPTAKTRVVQRLQHDVS
jgi:hypothetical protein